MNTHLVLLAVFTILLAVVMKYIQGRVRRKHPKSGESLPYPQFFKANSILTATEFSFFRSLELAVEGQCLIMCKMRLIDLLIINKQEDIGWFNKLVPRHVDFVLCSLDTLMPLCVVELDDASHLREDRKAKDIELNTVLESCGIDCARFRPSHTYSISTIRTRLESHLRKAATRDDENPDARYMPNPAKSVLPSVSVQISDTKE